MFTFFHGLIGTTKNWDLISSYFGDHNPKILTHALSLDYTKPIDILISETQNKISTILSDLPEKQNSIAVGNSLGSFISLKMADRFDKIILTAPPYKFKKGKLIRNKKEIYNKIEELFYNKHVLNNHKQEIQKVVDLWSLRLKDRAFIKKLRLIKLELTNYDFDKFYKIHQEKIHFVLGENDTISPIEEMKKDFIKNYPEAKITILNNCGHAVPLEKPKELIKILREYSG